MTRSLTKVSIAALGLALGLASPYLPNLSGEASGLEVSTAWAAPARPSDAAVDIEYQARQELEDSLARGFAPDQGSDGKPGLGGTQPAVGFRCLPSCAADDARFLAVASGASLATLSETSLDIEVGAPAGSTSFQFGIFDGDADAGAGDRNWDVGSGLFEYTLYADPLRDGTGTEVVAGPFSSGSLPNNDWFDVTVNTGPEAQAPSGHFFYRLSIESLDESSVVLNSFKVRTEGVMTIEVSQQPFGFYAAIQSQGDALTVFPGFPAYDPSIPSSTTYDGTFDVFIDVPAGMDELVLWGGDLDFGAYDGSTVDSDDPNTPNAPFLPDWATSDAVPEGVAVGINGTSGNPPDDVDPAGLGMFLQRSPSIVFDVIAPDGAVYSNQNPSGNQEWELFRIATGPFDPSQTDVPATSLPGGPYIVHASGVDMQNLNFWRFFHPVICEDVDGSPCQPLRAFLVGDTVFEDSDGDGFQDPGESGIDHVMIELLSANGAVIDQALTSGGGAYVFEVDAGAYSVRVAASNFAPGGALQGMVSTTGDEISDTVVDDNVLTYDFGYSGTGSIGNFVWLDANGDGIDNEPAGSGIAGVTVRLTGAGADGSLGTGDDVVYTPQVTDAAGGYLFTDLSPGTYRVDVDETTLPAGLQLTTGNEPLTVALASGQDYDDADFGYQASGAGTCTLEPLDLANGFSLFVLGDLSHANTDAEGRVAAGGNGTFSSYGVGVKLTNSNGTRDDLVVGGDITYTNGTVYNGNLVYGGTASLSGVTVLHGTARQDAPIDFTAARTYLEGASGQWAALPANGTTTVQYWGGPTAQITLDGSDADLNVFDLGGADLSAANTLNINAPSGSTVVVNIDGATNRMQYFGISVNGTDKTHVLYNFFETTSLTLQGIGIQGSVLAPYAHIDFNNGNIDGTLIGASMSGFGEVHHYPYAGCLPPYEPPGGGEPGSIGDRVWWDADGDGVQDPGEPALNGVGLTLFDAASTPVAMATTAGDGEYTFSDVPPGTYKVIVDASTLPPGLFPSFDADGIASPDQTTVPLASGETRTDVDFGYLASEIDYCVSRALSDPTWHNGHDDHALWLPGIGRHFVFEAPSEFTEYPDGTAHLVATAFDLTSPTRRFQVDVTFTGRSDTPPPGSPKKELKASAYAENGGPVDIATWHYYSDFTGYLFGDGALVGAAIEVERRGPAFQVGVGASGKNIHLGGSGWLTWQVLAQPINGSLQETGEGDFNLDFGTCPSGGVCLPDMDFETGGDFFPLYPGDIVDEQFAPYGVHASTNAPASHPLMIFGSGAPTGGDDDLGTPNEDFLGPGIGSGGAAGTDGENALSLYNLLILSEDGDSNDPDDNASGGTMVFEFDTAVELTSVKLVDIDANESVQVRAYDAGGFLLTIAASLPLGDNSVQEVFAETTGVRRLELVFSGSGALAQITYCGGPGGGDDDDDD
ncbi:MAG: choice-of-anchor A family protein, partial [Acidobacteria bacterium]|nr:choice-of-anchor A family protein [Acidobacteriota bacterium]